MNSVLSALGLILAILVADARLFNAPKRLRVGANEEESGIQYYRLRMDENRFLQPDLSMSMSGACASLNEKQCKREETCSWEGSACTQGESSFPTYSPTMDQALIPEITAAEMSMTMPTYSPTKSFPTYSPTELAAEKPMSASGCGLHLKKKPCVKAGMCVWNGSFCSHQKRKLRAN
jgi:hypothetical protein